MVFFVPVDDNTTQPLLKTTAIEAFNTDAITSYPKEHKQIFWTIVIIVALLIILTAVFIFMRHRKQQQQQSNYAGAAEADA